jgi:hypothetical protein
MLARTKCEYTTYVLQYFNLCYDVAEEPEQNHQHNTKDVSLRACICPL